MLDEMHEKSNGVRGFRKLTARAVPLARRNVDTDQIIPARFLKSTTREDLSEGLFAGWRFSPDGSSKDGFILDEAAYNGARVLLAGDNFGCGSSREHAAWALLDHGFRAVLSTRFADIFRCNCLNNGLLVAEMPQEFMDLSMRLVEEDPTTQVSIDLEASSVRVGSASVAFTIDPFARHRLLNGLDPLEYLLKQQQHIAAYEALESASGGRTQPVTTTAPCGV